MDSSLHAFLLGAIQGMAGELKKIPKNATTMINQNSESNSLESTSVIVNVVLFGRQLTEAVLEHLDLHSTRLKSSTDKLDNSGNTFQMDDRDAFLGLKGSLKNLLHFCVQLGKNSPLLPQSARLLAYSLEMIRRLSSSTADDKFLVLILEGVLEWAEAVLQAELAASARASQSSSSSSFFQRLFSGSTGTVQSKPDAPPMDVLFTLSPDMEASLSDVLMRALQCCQNLTINECDDEEAQFWARFAFRVHGLAVRCILHRHLSSESRFTPSTTSSIHQAKRSTSSAKRQAEKTTITIVDLEEVARTAKNILAQKTNVHSSSSNTAAAIWVQILERSSECSWLERRLFQAQPLMKISDVVSVTFREHPKIGALLGMERVALALDCLQDNLAQKDKTLSIGGDLADALGKVLTEPVLDLKQFLALPALPPISTGQDYPEAKPVFVSGLPLGIKARAWRLFKTLIRHSDLNDGDKLKMMMPLLQLALIVIENEDDCVEGGTIGRCLDAWERACVVEVLTESLQASEDNKPSALLQNVLLPPRTPQNNVGLKDVVGTACLNRLLPGKEPKDDNERADENLPSPSVDGPASRQKTAEETVVDLLGLPLLPLDFSVQSVLIATNDGCCSSSCVAVLGHTIPPIPEIHAILKGKSSSGDLDNIRGGGSAVVSLVPSMAFKGLQAVLFQVEDLIDNILTNKESGLHDRPTEDVHGGLTGLHEVLVGICNALHAILIGVKLTEASREATLAVCAVLIRLSAVLTDKSVSGEGGGSSKSAPLPTLSLVTLIFLDRSQPSSLVLKDLDEAVVGGLADLGHLINGLSHVPNDYFAHNSLWDAVWSAADRIKEPGNFLSKATPVMCPALFASCSASLVNLHRQQKQQKQQKQTESMAEVLWWENQVISALQHRMPHFFLFQKSHKNHEEDDEEDLMIKAWLCLTDARVLDGRPRIIEALLQTYLDCHSKLKNANLGNPESNKKFADEGPFPAITRLSCEWRVWAVHTLFARLLIAIRLLIVNDKEGDGAASGGCRRGEWKPSEAAWPLLLQSLQLTEREEGDNSTADENVRKMAFKTLEHIVVVPFERKTPSASPDSTAIDDHNDSNTAYKDHDAEIGEGENTAIAESATDYLKCVLEHGNVGVVLSLVGLLQEHLAHTFNAQEADDVSDEQRRCIGMLERVAQEAIAFDANDDEWAAGSGLFFGVAMACLEGLRDCPSVPALQAVFRVIDGMLITESHDADAVRHFLRQTCLNLSSAKVLERVRDELAEGVASCSTALGMSEEGVWMSLKAAATVNCCVHCLRTFLAQHEMDRGRVFEAWLYVCTQKHESLAEEQPSQTSIIELVSLATRFRGKDVKMYLDGLEGALRMSCPDAPSDRDHMDGVQQASLDNIFEMINLTDKAPDVLPMILERVCQWSQWSLLSKQPVPQESTEKQPDQWHGFRTMREEISRMAREFKQSGAVPEFNPEDLLRWSTDPSNTNGEGRFTGINRPSPDDFKNDDDGLGLPRTFCALAVYVWTRFIPSIFFKKMSRADKDQGVREDAILAILKRARPFLEAKYKCPRVAPDEPRDSSHWSLFKNELFPVGMTTSTHFIIEDDDKRGTRHGYQLWHGPLATTLRLFQALNANNLLWTEELKLAFGECIETFIKSTRLQDAPSHKSRFYTSDEIGRDEWLEACSIQVFFLSQKGNDTWFSKSTLTTRIVDALVFGSRLVVPRALRLQYTNEHNAKEEALIDDERGGVIDLGKDYVRALCHRNTRPLCQKIGLPVACLQVLFAEQFLFPTDKSTDEFHEVLRAARQERVKEILAEGYQAEMDMWWFTVVPPLRVLELRLILGDVDLTQPFVHPDVTLEFTGTFMQLQSPDKDANNDDGDGNDGKDGEEDAKSFYRRGAQILLPAWHTTLLEIVEKHSREKREELPRPETIVEKWMLGRILGILKYHTAATTNTQMGEQRSHGDVNK